MFSNEIDNEKLIDEWLIDAKVRDERRKRVYLVRSFLDPTTKRMRMERRLVSNRRAVRKLRYELRVDPQRHTLTVVKPTTMRLLLAVLGRAIYEKKDDCPEGVNNQDWRSTLELAKQRLRERPRTIGAIYDAIIPRRRVNGRMNQIVCKGCRTPLLFGFILDGHKVTRRKEFCSDACKMKARRPKSSSGTASR